MSERLEEIERKLPQLTNVEDEDVMYADICVDSIAIDMQWLVDFAKEQAKRVQELEKTNKKNYWIAADFKFENLKLEEQNKRYRKAIYNAERKCDGEANSILKRALESESE